MGHRQVPIADGERFVFVITEADHGFGFALGFGPIQVSRRIIDRIAAQHDQCAHLACIQSLREVSNGPLPGLRRLVENDRMADISESRVDRVGQGMHRQRLAMPRQHHGLARVLFGEQVFGAFHDPFFVSLGRLRQRLQLGRHSAWPA